MAYRHMIANTADALENTMTNMPEPTEEEISDKLEAEDFDVLVSPEFYDGEARIRVVIEGLDALMAALRSGNEPCLYQATSSECCRVGLLESGDNDLFLQSCDGDHEFVMAATRLPY
jgi:hypothetical protein